MTQGSAEGRDEDAQVPSGLDTTVAHQARIYDYWLGGKDNFAVDREAAEQAIAAYPPILRAVRAQRAFLARAVRFLAERGIRQFLDIGTGIPTDTVDDDLPRALGLNNKGLVSSFFVMVIRHVAHGVRGFPGIAEHAR